MNLITRLKILIELILNSRRMEHLGSHRLVLKSSGLLNY